jgi:hypothetical protein
MKYRVPNAELEAQHHSRARGFGAIRPRNMSQMPITHEQATALGEIVLSVFADMSNAGATLEETLRAIYMTGVENTLETLKEQETKQ